MKFSHAFLFPFSLTFFLFFSPSLLHAQINGIAKDSVVRIDVSIFDYTYKNPWLPPRLKQASGTGFIIEGNRILTNAHVVSSANNIRVRRSNQREDFEAEIEFIAHDCDLALLKVKDSGFFENAHALLIGKVPELNSPVFVVGFPIGGDRVSITRGVVSRKDLDLYSHSGIDSHLILQVDAAINPGNSGGPALQDGKVIGVAFQGLRGGENLGYLIPPPVINRFLTDISDGKYDGYIEFGVVGTSTKNPALLKYYGADGILKPPETGILVSSVLKDSSADGFLEKDDIIVALNGKSISHDGDVEIDGYQLSYTELVDNLIQGTVIRTKILRNKKLMEIQFPARATSIMQYRRPNYDSPPRMRIFAGFVFQPLDANLMREFAKLWSEKNRSEIFYHYNYHVLHELYKKRSEYVILTTKLSDEVNIYSDRFLDHMVESVNDKEISDFASFSKILDDELKGSEYVVIRFVNKTIPLVLKSADVIASKDRILKKYSIPTDRLIGTEEVQK